jgi:hypothetical protein
MDGRATVGDVVQATGLSSDDAQLTLKELLGGYEGHMEVGEHGDLVYSFDPRLIRRDHVSTWTRIREGAKAFLTKAFKVWIMLMLVVYFVVFVVLIIAAFVAIMSRGDDNRGFGGGRRGRGGGIPFPIWWWFWSPGYGRRRHYYGARYAGKDDKVPFYRKVFAFVFGPDRPELTRTQKDRSLVRLIRSRAGVLTATELVQHSGSTLPEAEDEMARLMGAYDGDVKVSDDGEIYYTFPELMVSAHGPVTAKEPPPAWRRLERPLELTGNEKKDDAIVAGLNGFNLLAAALAPGFIFPALGIGGPAAWVGLVAVPLVFSAFFFGVPLVRRLRLKRENAARERRNVRKLLEGPVFEGALLDRSVDPEEAYQVVAAGLGQDPGVNAVRDEMNEMAAEFEADVVATDTGALRFRFPRIRSAFLAAARARDRLRLGRRSVGDIVYSSADDEVEASRRDLEAFDRELAGYVAAPGRADYFDDVDVAALEEQRDVGRARGR